MSAGPGPGSLAAARSAFEAFAATASRALSSRAQAPVALTLEAVADGPVEILAGRLDDHDRAVALTHPDGTGAGFIALSRPLAFALLALRFGARGLSDPACDLERPHTPLEERSLARTAEDLFRELAEIPGVPVPPGARAVAWMDAAALRERTAGAFWLATFVAPALASDARLHLAVPCERFRVAADPASGAGGSGSRGGNDAGTTRSVLGTTHANPAPGGAARTTTEGATSRTRAVVAGDPGAAGLRPGSRLSLDLGGGELRLDDRPLARGRIQFADALLRFDVEELLAPGASPDAD